MQKYALILKDRNGRCVFMSSYETYEAAQADAKIHASKIDRQDVYIFMGLEKFEYKLERSDFEQ